MKPTVNKTYSQAITSIPQATAPSLQNDPNNFIAQITKVIEEQVKKTLSDIFGEKTQPGASYFYPMDPPKRFNDASTMKPGWPKGKPRKPPINKQPNDDTLKPTQPSQEEVISSDKEDPPPVYIGSCRSKSCLSLEFTICNIYLPDANWNIADLINIADQLPPPYVIVGDFNAHNPIWGSTRIDTRGRIVDNFIDEMNLVILNSGEGTYLNLRSNSLSVIDLAFCSPTLAPSIQWKCLGDHLTDHFSISIEFASRYITQSIPRKWKLDKANWPLYKENIIQIQTPMDDVDRSTRFISDKIIDAAKIAVPQTSGRKGKKTTPWWNDEIANL
ncbi:hypothetical protein JTB14_013578 [Gonioctena quinquepunctata]|nr:hypothetical protein JTB14_013578 [Gonioctena quinquepunctata]